MSYDLVVFKKDAAPKTRIEFREWFEIKSDWKDDYDYLNPLNASNELRLWYNEMIEIFLPLNSVYVKFDEDQPFSDYVIENEMIYICFPWSKAELAYEIAKKIAEKYQLGFYDISADDGDIYFPDNNGTLKPIENLSNPLHISSIDQFRNSAIGTELEGKTVKEILYTQFMQQFNKK